MADDPKWEPMTSEQRQKLMRSPGVIAKITEAATKLCNEANAMAPTKTGDPNFAVVVQNDPGTSHPRAYVRPIGKTGIHVEQGQSVLLKAIGTMGAQ